MLVRQYDQSDCGVACLLSIVKFYDGSATLEELRETSGTSKQGTTLLGLLQASRLLGFEAEGMEADGVDSLAELTGPAILHVVIDNRLQHYVVYYPDASQSFSANRQAKLKIGDPARGILDLSPEELDGIWKSKALLKLVPNEKFEKVTLQKAKKRQWIFSLVREDLSILTISMGKGNQLSSIFSVGFHQHFFTVVIDRHFLQLHVVGNLFGRIPLANEL